MINYLRKVLGCDTAIATMKLDFDKEINDSREELSKLAGMFKGFQEDMAEHMLMKHVNKALDEALPDMMWAKDLDGKYLLANKAIRDRLLFDDEPLGKDDVTMATARKEAIGAKNHTFGEICGNSDLITVQESKPMKFNEDGLVSGQYMMLQVHKNVIKDENGMIIGTVGIGRDITYEIVILKDILENTECLYAKSSINRILKHYEYNDRS